jgi:hypothetical protein
MVEQLAFILANMLDPAGVRRTPMTDCDSNVSLSH